MQNQAPGNKLTAFIRSEMSDHQVVGLSISVVHDREVVFTRGFGYQNREAQIAASSQTVYRMGSISKVLTAMAIMQLVENSKIELDAPVTRYLPEFSMKSRGKATDAITVRQLLTHHSGVPTDLMKGADTLHPDSLKVVVNRLKDEYTAFAPGDVFLYSNLGYAVLGRIIEVVSQLPYETYIRRNIFTPLDMTHSGFHAGDFAVNQTSTGYMNGHPGTLYPMREISAGALYASTADIAKLIQSVFAGGAPLLKAATQRQMLTRQNSDCPMDLDVAMGLGWQLTRQLPKDKNAGLTAWHDGWLWHFSSYMLVLPEHKLGVIVAANTDTSKKAVRAIAKKAIQYFLWHKAGVQRTVAVPPSPASGENLATVESINQLAGSYDTAHGLFHLKANDGRLEGLRNGHPVVLVPLADGRFEMRRKLNAVVSWKSPELDGVYFRFVHVGAHTILATMDGDVRIPFGHRVAPPAIPLSWKKRVGTWKVVAHDGDYAYIRSIRIETRQQFLVARVHIDSKDDRQMVLNLALKPETSHQAQVMGVGRYRGDTLYVEKHPRRGVQLRFQGYRLVPEK